MKSILVFVTIMVLLIIFVGMTFAQPTGQQEVDGFWRDWEDDIRVSAGRGSSILEQSEIDVILERLADVKKIFRDTDILNKLRGFEVKPARKINIFSSEMIERIRNSAQPVPSELHLFMYPYFLRDGTIFEGEELWTWKGNISVFVNNPTPEWGIPYRTVNNEQWYIEPREVGRFGTFPVYENRNRPAGRSGLQRFVLVSQDIVPPLWLPVTCEEFIRHEISQHEAQLRQSRERLSQLPSPDTQREQMILTMERTYEQLKNIDLGQAEQFRAQMEKTISDMYPQDQQHTEHQVLLESTRKQMNDLEARIHAIRPLLDSMPPLERNSQAKIILDLEQTDVAGLAKPGVEGASSLVRINPSIFKQGDPVTSFRFIIITTDPGSGRDSDWAQENLDLIMEDLDWEALAGLLN
jgi:hypothetical protein